MKKFRIKLLQKIRIGKERYKTGDVITVSEDVYNTLNKSEICILLEEIKGKSDGEEKRKADYNIDTLSLEELRIYAKDKGVKNTHVMGIPKLKEKLSELGE